MSRDSGLRTRDEEVEHARGESARVRLARRLAILCLAQCALACGSQKQAPAPPPPPAGPVVEERLVEPYLPVRTEFTVTLDAPIGTNVVAQNQSFTARVQHPVRSPDNEIVLKTDAILHGHVVAVDRKPALRVRVKFDDIETIWGSAPLGATIRNAEPYATASPGRDDATMSFDAALMMPTAAPPPPVERAIGGGPVTAPPFSEILLPKGAELRVLLVKPLVPPEAAHLFR